MSTGLEYTTSTSRPDEETPCYSGCITEVCLYELLFSAVCGVLSFSSLLEVCWVLPNETALGQALD